MLLAGALTMCRGFLKIAGTDLGLRTDHALVMNVALCGTPREKNAPAYYREALERLGGVPGVEAAGAVEFMPLEPHNMAAFRFKLGGAEEHFGVPITTTADYLRATSTNIGSTEGPEVNSVSLATDGLPVIPPGYKGHIIGMKLAGKTMLRAKGESLNDFAKLLTGELDRPVFDFTGLTQKYDFGIAWSTDEAIANGSNPSSALEPGPDVFAAFQAQLGLKLEPRKTPVEMVVVDRVEKVPTAN